MKKLLHLPLIVASILMLMPKTASACAVCLGASDSAVRPAMNAAIFVMLGAIGSMLAALAGFMVYLNKRAKTHGADSAQP